MRWDVPENPRLYATRTREFFAWLPYKSHGTAYWLEFITVTEYYIVQPYDYGRWDIVGDVVSARSPWSF